MKATSIKGFTLMELMIVLAVLAILAAIAIPNLLRGRIRTNETNAAAALSSYGTAQEIWRKSAFGGVAGNNYDYGIESSPTDPDFDADDLNRVESLNVGPRAFADNFRNLFYAFPAASAKARVKLLDQGIADAFYPSGGNLKATTHVRLARSAPTVEKNADNDSDSYTNRVAGRVTAPKSGYIFAEDVFMATGSADDVNGEMGWNYGYGLIAYPAVAGRTGDNLFWIGFNQPIHMAGTNPATDNTTAPARLALDDSPMNPNARRGWIVR